MMMMDYPMGSFSVVYAQLHVLAHIFEQFSCLVVRFSREHPSDQHPVWIRVYLDRKQER